MTVVLRKGTSDIVYLLLSHELNGPTPEVQHRKWGPYLLDKYTGQVSGFKHLHFKYQNHKVN